MSKQILFIGGPLDQQFEEVDVPLPDTLQPDEAQPPVTYRLYTITENVRRRGERKWPVYVYGALPSAAEVLRLWWVRAKIWQSLEMSASRLPPGTR